MDGQKLLEIIAKDEVKQRVAEQFTVAKSPVNIANLELELKGYNPEESEILLNGFREGFPIHYEGPRINFEAKNLKSVYQFPEIVNDKISKEVKEGRVAGPFDNKPLPIFRVSPIGLVPKKNPGEYRLIHHLSYPPEGSVNDFIDNKWCSVNYTEFDKAVEMIQNLGKGALLFKVDIKSAFRLLPVCPQDFDLLGFKFEGKYYFDKCLPFGCSISCKTFESFSTFLEFMVRRAAQSDNLIHYLDDFLGAGKRDTLHCSLLMETFFTCMKKLNVPLATEKTEGPVEVLSFLGLELDSVAMQTRIPDDKVKEVLEKIDSLLAKDRTTLRDMQSLIGSLNFACRAIPPGRPFCRRLINAIKGLTKPHHHLRVTKSIKADLNMWNVFLREFNGISLFHNVHWSANSDVDLFTDSAGGEDLGFGIYFAGRWTYGKWPKEWHAKGLTTDITFLEIFPIWVALVLWGAQLTKQKICFHCDNKAVVDIIAKMSSRNDNVMVILRAITLACMRHNIIIKAQHVPGVQNNICDALSRLQIDRFRNLAPQADTQPTQLPPGTWDIFKKQ